MKWSEELGWVQGILRFGKGWTVFGRGEQFGLSLTLFLRES